MLAGSLPPGAPATYYADLVPRLRAVSRVAIDTSDAPLAALVERLPQNAPDLLKPNAEELASITGTEAAALEADPGAAAKASRTLVERGVGAVLASLGAKGAVLVDLDGAWYAPSPPTTVVSTVGAGDCTLFGYLLGSLRGLPAPDRLALAVAYGAAAAGLPGTTIPHPADLHPERVAVQSLDPHLGDPMPSKSVTVGSSVGLHARPAAIISEAAAGLGVTINGVDAGSSLMIMTLGAKYGDTVEVAGDDDAAVAKIAELVVQDLDADDA